MINRLAALLLSIFALSSTALAHFENEQIWLIDHTNSRLYRIDIETGTVFQPLDASDGLNGPGAIGFSLHGHIIVANFNDNMVFEFEPDLASEVVLTSADGISGPFGGNGIIIGPGHGDVYISNTLTNEVLKFTEDYDFEEVVLGPADGLVNAAAMTFLPDGDLLVANKGGSGEIFHVTEDGVVTVYTTLVGINPAAMVTRNNGDVYLASDVGAIYRMIGGDPLNMVQLANLNTVVSDQALSFNADYSKLYHVAAVNGSFRSIDPDSGALTFVATVSGNPSAMIVVGSHYPHGTFVNFGEALAGTGGELPTLEGHGEPRIGEPATVEIENFVGGTQVFVFISTTAAESTLFGGEFHIVLGPGATFIELPLGGTPGAAGAGELSLPFLMPNIPSIVGVKFYLQALGVDPAAPFGVSMTDCLTMYVGE
jgi:hypothetical protein